MRRLLLLLLLLGLNGTAFAADETYYVGIASGAPLYSSPSTRSIIIRQLDADTPVTVIAKQKSWWYVEMQDANKTTGWMTEGSLRQRTKQTRENGTSSFFTRFASWFHDDRTQKTAVLGVRGLDQGGNETGGTAQANMAAVDWMDGLGLKRAEVNRFIREGGLKK